VINISDSPCSANILLDRNFEAKVGDFGLAREMSPNSAGASYVKVSRVHGTRPYLPDEYLRSKKLSTKVDTFSFGIMLFEVVTGQRAYEESRQKKYLKDLFDETENPEVLKDQRGGQDSPDVFWILVKLGKACTQRLAKDRPEMVQVLKSLEGLMSQASSIRKLG
jgi:interleukin-1 receptor-associated kinase 1